MVLKTKEFSDCYGLVRFVNRNNIKQGNIQAIVYDNDGFFHLVYWESEMFGD